MTIALVAIAKNEGAALAEWLAHHISLGFDRIFVYDNESDDSTAAILDALGSAYPITRIYWSSQPGASPQIAAYNDAIANRLNGFEWVAFIDCDEFLVLQEDQNLKQFLGRFGSEVGAVGLNWVTLASSGYIEANYELVTTTFLTGPDKNFSNNHHIKTIARVNCVAHMWIHHAELKAGQYFHASGDVLPMERPGISDIIDHRIAFINHYQLKSREEYDRKIDRGRAGAISDDPDRIRSDGDEIWNILDVNEARHDEINRHAASFKPLYITFCKILERAMA